MSPQVQALSPRLALTLPKPGQSVLSRLFDELDAAMDEARQRSDLRRRLHADANIRRDIGVTRFEMLQISGRT